MRPATLILAAALFAGAAARAQEPAPLERIEAETAVLKRELKALHERVAAIEARVKALEPPGTPERAATAEVTKRAGVVATGPASYFDPSWPWQSFGKDTPEELVTGLLDMLYKLTKPTKLDVAIFLAFRQRGRDWEFLVPAATWTAIKPAAACGAPTAEGIEAALQAIAPRMQGASLEAMRAEHKGAIATFEITFAKDGARVRVALTAVEVNERWLLAEAKLAD